jgi:hypothetical protein
MSNIHDSDNKILPDMVEAASWMASMSSEVLNHILEHDPKCLLESDVALSEGPDRKRLLVAILEAIEKRRAVQTRWIQKSQLESLNFVGIDQTLEPYLSNKDFSKETRDFAIDVASGCSVHHLAPALATVALDKHESEVLRRSAAWAVTRLDHEESRQRLKVLLNLADEEDPLEDLKGCA